ncbi:hypothetical protein C8R46DRAFT_827697, partial [Mycena filopes]
KTAGWLKQEEIMKQFISALGGTCVYKPRRVEMVAEMVPIELPIESPGTWRVVEAESGLKAGDIVAAKWLKLPSRRSPNQRVAHVVLELKSPEAANHLIDNGIFSKGKYMNVKKPEDKAQRCLRCQSYDGHFAAACKAAVDMCGRCAGAHRTSNCNITDSGIFTACANCQVQGHAASDRNCPQFLRAQERRRARDPMAGYRYFPTDDPRTW